MIAPHTSLSPKVSNGMNSLLLRFPQHLLGFFNWLTHLMPVRIFHWFEDFLATLDGNLKLGANAKLWISLEPLFGDYGWRGRLVGFLFRTVRMIGTLLTYLVVILIGLLTIVGWYLLLPLSVALIFGFI